MRLLIDGDPIVYRIGFASQKKNKETGLVTADPVSFAKHSCKLYMDRIIEDTECDEYTVFLTGKDNFRFKVREDYKANRAGTDKPVHYQVIRDYLVSRYSATVIEGMEADDALALSQTEDTAIATIDKDLLMVPGKHYNYVKEEWKEVTEEWGHRFFHHQMLTGDKVDNIIGLKGIGPKKADKLLDDTPIEDWEEMIVDLYNDQLGYGEGFQRAVENSQLLWMLQRDKQMPLGFNYD